MRLTFVIFAAAVGCTPAPPTRTLASPTRTLAPGSPTLAPAHGATAPPPPATVAIPASGYRYEIRATEGAEELWVDAAFAAGSPAELSVDDGAEPFVRGVAVAAAEGPFVPLAATGTAWMAPTCQARGCRVRYRFALAEAARRLDDANVAEERDGVFLAPPSTWLLHPLDPPAGAPFRMHVTAPPGIAFVTGVLPAADGAADTWEADVSDIYETPFSAFGPLVRVRVETAGGSVEVARLPGDLAVGDDVLARWVGDAARAVGAYYGRFPLRHTLVLLEPSRGAGIGYARTLGNGGATILAPVGRALDAAALDDDWVMTHEMVHLATPNLPRAQAWLEEGLATYVEPIARARVGALAVERVWRGFVRGMPLGKPGPGDRGLDATPTWGRTYWGGATFCLVADVEIRKRTAGARSLDDALRGIVEAGGSVAVRWPVERFIAVGDAATGVGVLGELHRSLGLAPGSVDLDGLWHELGVRTHRGRVTFDDTAPLASIRRAITAPRP